MRQWQFGAEESWTGGPRGGNGSGLGVWNTRITTATRIRKAGGTTMGLASWEFGGTCVWTYNTTLLEVFERACVLPDIGTVYVEVRDTTNTAVARVTWDTSTTKFSLSVRGVTVWTSTNNYPASVANGFYRIELHVVFGGAAAGNVQVRIDGGTESYSSGLATNSSGTGLLYRAYNTQVNGAGAYWDDMACNDTFTALEYDGGSGTTPAAGDTVTDGGAKSATVKYVFGDAVRGIMAIENSGAAFANNDALQIGATWTGSANGAENTDNTSWVGNGYIVALRPNANGTTTQLTNSAGTMVNNYSYVDDNSTTDYVEGAADGLYDTYGIEDLPSSTNLINSLWVLSATSKTDATVTGMAPTFRISAADYEWYTQIAPDSFGNPQWWPTIQNPATLGAWSVATIDAMEAGPKVKA